MVGYIGNMRNDIPEEMKGVSATPAAYHIFDIARDATKLSRTGSDLFRHLMAQLLYLSKSSRPDIHLAV